MRMVAVDGPWARRLLPVAKTRPFNETVEGLYDLLATECSSVEVWETTHVQVFEGFPAVGGWMQETLMAPFLKRLDEEFRQIFIERYIAELARNYPLQPNGKVLVRFPRLSLLAQRQQS
jgi:trans-aconitate 2-methyltransferase